MASRSESAGTTAGPDFRHLYDTMEEYVKRRDPNSFQRQSIVAEAKHFKIPGLLAVLPPSFPYRTVLEIGCATGDLIAQFPGPADVKRAGVDISPLNVQEASERYPTIDFYTGDFRDLKQKFDIVILSDILEHVPDDTGFLREAARLARVLLINLPLEKCWHYAFRRYGPTDSSGHLRKYSLSDGLRLFDLAGLKTIDFRQDWIIEHEFTQIRLDLRQHLEGKRYRGGVVMRCLKSVTHAVLTRNRWLARRALPSNLFAALEGTADA